VPDGKLINARTMKDFESFTKRGKARRCRRALTEALEAYAIEVRSLRFVSHDNSMPVYRVCADSGEYVAKFHDPGEHTLSQMVGELRFLNHVSKHSDLRVPTPLANREGEFITELTSVWLPDVAHVALSSWLPGTRLRDAMSVRSYRCLGECAARLHEVSPSFRPGRAFEILTNDRVFYWDKETILSRRDPKLLPNARQRLFREAARASQRAIRRLWASGKPMVIHNDLHPCNVKVHCGELSLYDFEDITWGFPEQDIGTAMYHIRFRDDYHELLSAFREGYEQARHWPLDSDEQLDQFVTARLLMFANYVVNYNLAPAKRLPRFDAMLKAL